MREVGVGFVRQGFIGRTGAKAVLAMKFVLPFVVFPLEHRVGVGKVYVIGVVLLAPSSEFRKVDRFIEVCELLHDVLVVCMESSELSNEIDIVATDRLEFFRPEPIVLRVVAKIDVDIVIAEFSIPKACHKGDFVKLRHLSPRHSSEFILRSGRGLLPVDPSFFWNDDTKSIFGVEHLPVLIIDIRV